MVPGPGWDFYFDHFLTTFWAHLLGRPRTIKRPFFHHALCEEPGQDFNSKMPKKSEGAFFNILGKPLGKLGQFSQGLDPGPAQGLTWASPGLDPGQPRSIFWSRFWSNRTTETTAGTETTKGGRARLCEGMQGCVGGDGVGVGGSLK